MFIVGQGVGICLMIMATASMAVANTPVPSIGACVELLSGMDESGPVSSAELCSGMANVLGLKLDTPTATASAASGPQAGLLVDSDVVRTVQELFSLPFLSTLAEAGRAEAALQPALESLDVCSLITEVGDLPARLVRALLAAESTKAAVERLFTVDDPTIGADLAAIVTGPAIAETIVGLGEALAECDTLQPIANDIKSIIETVVLTETDSSANAGVVEALSPLIMHQAVRDAAGNLIASVAPQLLPVLMRWSGSLDALLEQLPGELKQYHGEIEGVFSSAPLAALAGATVRSEAGFDALMLSLDGEMTDAKFQEDILPKLLKTRSIFKALADVLRDDTVATLISGVTGAIFDSGNLNDSDGWALSTIRNVLQSRFLLNRIAGLIETTPIGTEIAMVWMKQDAETVDCVKETATLISTATLSSTSDLATGAAAAAMDSFKNIADDPAAAAAAAAEQAQVTATAASEAAAAAWGSFSSWYSSDDVETKDDL